MKNSLIKAEKISKTYRQYAEDIHAINGVDFEIQEGDFIAVMGPSGSGKTTLLDALGCLTNITDGKLVAFGTDVSGGKESVLLSVRRRQIGFVFQDFLLVSSLTVLENVLLPLYLAREPIDKARAMEMIDRVGLKSRRNHYPYQLSGGEKQRTAIARALVTKPGILFADEPTGNLDTKSSQLIFDLFKELNQKEGLTIFVVTHNPDLARQARTIINLKDGKITSN